MTVVLDKIQAYSEERYRQELTIAIIKSGLIGDAKYDPPRDIAKLINVRVEAIIESQK